MARACDAPNCRNVPTREFICDSCIERLPDEITVGLAEARHQRRWSDWTALRKAAEAYRPIRHRTPPAPLPAPRVSAERSFAMTQRLLGERDP